MSENVVPRDPGERGTLTIRDAALVRIAELAALESSDISRHARNLDLVTGRALPRVDIRVAGERVRATVEVAVGWPVTLSSAAADVRDRVGGALHHAAGLAVDAVDVTISHIAYVDPSPRRRVQ